MRPVATIPGANVYLKDKPGVGTITDVAGVFSIKASKRDIIVFTFIGYQDIEYPVEKAEKNLKITFKVMSQNVEEVVVTAIREPAQDQCCGSCEYD